MFAKNTEINTPLSLSSFIEYNHRKCYYYLYYLTSNDRPHPRLVFCLIRKLHVLGESHCWRTIGKRACNVHCLHPVPEDGREPGHRFERTQDGKLVECFLVLCETEKRNCICLETQLIFFVINRQFQNFLTRCLLDLALFFVIFKNLECRINEYFQFHYFFRAFKNNILITFPL